jgi:GNAT superfamily N-acetyltransferase
LRSGQEPQVFALIDRCYRQYGLALNLDDPCEQHLRDPGPRFRATGGEFWVVLDEAGGVRATGALYIHSASTPPLGELKSMYVDPDLRRRGLGRMLATLVMDAARAAGCRDMELWSDTRFTAAHAMYESLGFVRFGLRDVEDSNNSKEWGYRRPL